MSDLHFGLLGPMEIAVDGAAVPLPGTAERALLAQLLLSPGRDSGLPKLLEGDAKTEEKLR